MKPATEINVFHEWLFREPTELPEHFSVDEESLVAIGQ